MKIGERIADWLIERAARTPYTNLPGYMERTWVVPYKHPGAEPVEGDGIGPVGWNRPVAKVLQFFDVAVRVHHILRSDRGRDPHDHPRGYITIVLRGGYREERYDDLGDLASSTWHGPGSILIRRANSWHRLLIPYGETAWTLFITGPRLDELWGFNVDGKKVPYGEYTERENQ